MTGLLATCVIAKNSLTHYGTIAQKSSSKSMVTACNAFTTKVTKPKETEPHSGLPNQQKSSGIEIYAKVANENQLCIPGTRDSQIRYVEDQDWYHEEIGGVLKVVTNPHASRAP